MSLPGVEYVTGDLLQSNEMFIVHGCNCFGTMGSGIAKQIKDMYPAAYQADLDFVVPVGDTKRLGLCSRAIVDNPHTGNKLVIVNLYTQYSMGTDRRHVNYVALSAGMLFTAWAVMKSYKEVGGTTVLALPKIGAGLGGGDWNIIEQILSDIHLMTGVTFRVYCLP